MKLISALLFTPLLATALLVLPSTSSIDPAADCPFPVPGDQPLCFCTNPSDYILDVKNVTLTPNPPVPGQKLVIEGEGYFNEEIEKGAIVQLRVKYNKYITLINTSADMCEQLPKWVICRSFFLPEISKEFACWLMHDRIDIECPIEKGTMKIYKEVDLPARVPPGMYSVYANVLTADERLITCMEATVTFNKIGRWLVGGSMGELWVSQIWWSDWTKQ